MRYYAGLNMERDVNDIPLTPTTIVGVISDTHGLLRPEVPEVLRGVNLILHAGDIGNPEVLESLGSIAPVIAVRGNNDQGPWAKRIPDFQIVPIGPIFVYMVHDVKTMKLPARRKIHVVISGHSHRPSIDRREGILFLNPGSTGPRRFKLPISMAKLIVEGTTVRAELVEL
jgi:putative phosphoesterase